MHWCEENEVDHVLGLAKNKRLKVVLADSLDQAEQQFKTTKQPARIFEEFGYRMQKSWSRFR